MDKLRGLFRRNPGLQQGAEEEQEHEDRLSMSNAPAPSSEICPVLLLSRAPSVETDLIMARAPGLRKTRLESVSSSTGNVSVSTEDQDEDEDDQIVFEMFGMDD